MKKLEFETSKGRFLLIDSKDAPSSFNRYLRDIEKEFGAQLTTGYKISEITEEEASGIVDSNDEYGVVMYQNYQTTSMQYFDEQITAIESLYSLIKSKGVHLFENSHPRRYIMAMTDKGIVDTTENLYLEAEEKTFHNPYIFKICTKQQS